MSDQEAIRQKRLQKLQASAPTSPAQTQPQSPVKEAPEPAKQKPLQPQQPLVSPEQEIHSAISACLQVSHPGISQGNLDDVIVSRLSQEQQNSSQSSRLIEKSLVHYLLGCYNRAAKQINLAELLKKPHLIPALKSLQELCVSYSSSLLQFPDTFPQPQDVIQSGSAILTPALLSDEVDGEFSLSQEFLESLVRHAEADGLREIFSPLLLGLAAEMRQLSISKNYIPVLRAFTRLVAFKSIATMLTQIPSFNPRLGPRAMEVASLLGPLFRLTTFGTDDAEFSMAQFGQPTSRTRMYVEQVYTSFRVSIHGYHDMLHQIIMAIIRSSPQARDLILDYFAYLLKINENRGKMHIQDPKSVSTEGFMSNLYAVLLKLCEPLMDASFSKLHLIDPEYLRKSNRLDVFNATKLSSDPDSEKVYFSGPDTSYSAHFVTELFYLTVSAGHLGMHRTIRTYMDIMRHVKELSQNIETFKARLNPNSPTAQRDQLMLKRGQDQLDKLIAEKLSFDILLLDPKYLGNALQFEQLVLRFLARVATSPSAGVSLDDMQYAKGPHFRPKVVSSGQILELPLTHLPPTCFSMYPEYFLEDPMELILQITRFAPEVLMNGGSHALIDELAGFIVIFLRSRSEFKGQVAAPTTQELQVASESAREENVQDSALEIKRQQAFIKNPYLISKMVEVLFSFTWDYGGPLDSALKGVFGSHPLLKDYLASGLIAFYVDVEKTGLSSQFYDKFGIRYNISQIMKLMWNLYPETYRPKFMDESTKRWSVFVKFVNLIMNDTTYLLDESLSKLAEIHSVQNEMDSPQWASIPDTEREEKLKRLKELERGATSCMQLANEEIHMLCYLTTTIVDPFLRPEIIDRLAAMLNYNLVQLVGPKCTELKVKNAEKYSFQPRVLLSDIIQIYLHLSASRQEFVQAVARDGRSYSASHFQRAAGILESKALKSQTDIQQLLDFVTRCEQVRVQDAQAEEDMGDVPEEFLDPVMFSLMEDPVILPKSKITVDRSTIQSHLLSDSTDPFNRTPLTIDQVLPDVELKAKIDAWKAGKLHK